MKTIIVMRHAKSDWSGGGADVDRPLNERGRTDAPVMAKWLADQRVQPSAVFCSGAARTRETAALAMAVWGDTVSVTYDDEMYNAGPETLLSQATGAADSDSIILLLAHNPGVYEFSMGLLSITARGDAIEQMGKFPTGAVAVIKCNIGSWQELNWACGELAAFMIPKLLAE